jgi:hypothetical protein
MCFVCISEHTASVAQYGNNGPVIYNRAGNCFLRSTKLVYLHSGSSPLVNMNTKTSLYTPVEILVSAFGIYHRNVKFGNAVMNYS